MTIGESLIKRSLYPIASNFVEVACIDRELDSSADYTKEIGISRSYELALADTLMFIHDSPNIREQDSSITNLESVLQDLNNRANGIYSKYSDDKFSGVITGYVGENWND